jgi:hypothetical protein
MHSSLDRLQTKLNRLYLELGFGIYADRVYEIRKTCDIIIATATQIEHLQNDIMHLEYEESEDRSP